MRIEKVPLSDHIAKHTFSDYAHYAHYAHPLQTTIKTRGRIFSY